MRSAISLLVGALIAAGLPAAGGANPDEIPLRIVVTDVKGRAVRGLSPADVEVLDAGRQQTVQTFAATGGVPRTFGILLDEYHTSDAAASRAVTPLVAFVDHLRHDDVVFVMRPLDPASKLAPVASRDELRAMISQFSGRSGNFEARNAFEAEYLSAAPPMAVRQRAQIVRAAMQALATAMSKTDRASARAMIVVTEGFSPEDRGRERLATLRTVTRAARAANVAIYVVDPAEGAVRASTFGEQWNLMSEQTGGVLTSGVPVLPALLRVPADLDASYLLTIGKPEREDGAYHRLEIRPKRKDIAVRAPTGYWAPIAAERLTPPSRPSMSTFLKTPHVTGLIQPWFRMTRSGAGTTRVTFSWVAKPARTAGARVVLSAVTFEGKKLIDAEITPQGTAASSQCVFETAPGPIQVTMAISDASGKLLDTEVRYIDVPTLDSAGAMISAVEVVRTRTLREFLERQLAADIMPAETREFDRRDRLIVRVLAFSKTDQPPVVSARLLNPLGQPLRELTALPAVNGIPQFDLPLAIYARGDYKIEIRATAGGASTSHLVMFRLIG